MPKFAARFFLVAGLIPLTIPTPFHGQTDQTPGIAAQKTYSEVYQPKADPRATVILEHARFTVLTPQMIRMEWSADGKFEDHASLVFLNRKLQVPAYQSSLTKTPHGQELIIRTSSLVLTYDPALSAAGRFTPGNLAVEFVLNGKAVRWHPGMAETGNLLGTTRTLDKADGAKTIEPIEPGLISRDGWTIVDDSTRPLFDSSDFSFNQGLNSPWPWVLERAAGERQDWYFFGYGHDYKRALGDFVQVAGRIPLPPRFAFGAWWSRYWAYSDQELKDLVRGFKENDVPMDVLVIDMDWHPTFGQSWWNTKSDQSGHVLGWSGYSWNKLLFPDPEEFLKYVHHNGMKVTLNLHPASGVQPWEDRYPEMAKAMGVDPASQKYIPFDITNKKFATYYMDILHHPLEKQGVDFWWLDWQQEPGTRTPGVSPTWWLNYVHFTDQAREGKRPLLFHRWGGLGNHRYEIGFSGDTISSWDSLAFQPWFTATAANVGYAYWSHDIGGHMPGVVDPELYTRWVQFGAFSPILRTHTTKNPDAERRIWAYPEPYSSIMRQSFLLRYELLPYIYTEARHTYDTGVAFVRPLYYDWPEADEAYSTKDEYLFGSQILAAPVVTPVDPATGLANEPVWLPEGDWIEWPTGKHFRGPVSLKRNFSISQTPLYYRAGAIIPLAPPMHSTGEKPVDPLIVEVFPLANSQQTSYMLYEDAGDTRAYEQNQAVWTRLKASRSGNELTVTISPGQGTYPGMLHFRSYQLRLPLDWPPQTVLVNGHPLPYVADEAKSGWQYEGNTLTTVISIPAVPRSSSIEIVVRRAPDLVARQAELNGFPGTLERLREAYDTLNHNWPIGWSPDVLVDAMQCGSRLGYKPQAAGAEIQRFQTILPTAIKKVNEIAKGLTPEQLAILAQSTAGESNNANSEQQAKYRANTRMAEALLSDIANDLDSGSQ